MYHYVRPDDTKYPYFNNLNTDVFQRQLDYFKKTYGFVSKNDYIHAIRTGQNVDGVVLTFDDGFKDHYQYVMPELRKRGLWGLFYISTGVYQTKKLLGVHRIHYLNGKLGASKILQESLNLINNTMLDQTLINNFDKEIYKHSAYEDDEKELRRLYNYYIKYEYRDYLLDQLMEKYFDEESLFEKAYLSEDEIKELHHFGNIIGSHTVNHKVLSRLTYNEQYHEINSSFMFLDTLVKQNYKSFCYPYGYSSSYNQDTLNILKELEIDDAFIFDNKLQDDNIKQYQLSRIDCNQFMEV